MTVWGIMRNRVAVALVAVGVILSGSAARVLAHEGHDHKVMGTVTMAAPDHLMVKDRDGKAVTIQVTKDTKVRSKPALKVEQIKVGTRVVVTAVREKEVMKAKTIEVGGAPAAK
jgi:hypothetical protein